jgi:hypothetical protein
MRLRGGLVVVAMLAVMVLGAGCAVLPGRGEADVGAGSPAELGATLNVRVAADSVRLELHVTNVTAEVLRLEFATAQRYDFEVSVAGARVWRWSDDMMFAQVLGQEVVLPGESRRYTAAWPATGASGAYTATGWLTSTNYPVELRTAFRLPAQ